MRKTELTEEQQKEFKWLMEADTINEDVEVEDGTLIWKHGIWKRGIWEYGIWEGGTWKSGYWEYGIWEYGMMWSNIKQKFIKVEQKDGKFIEVNEK